MMKLLSSRSAHTAAACAVDCAKKRRCDEGKGGGFCFYEAFYLEKTGVFGAKRLHL